MLLWLKQSFGEIFILNEAKIISVDLSLTSLAFEAIKKTCFDDSLNENQTLEELSTYGEIQQDYHEGCPPTFAPPN